MLSYPKCRFTKDIEIVDDSYNPIKIFNIGGNFDYVILSFILINYLKINNLNKILLNCN